MRRNRSAVLIGFMFLLFGLFLGADQFRIISKGAKVSAIVSSNEKIRIRRIAPVVRYQFKGVFYEERSRLSSSEESFQVGEQITLYLDPSNPKDFVIYTPGSFIIAGASILAGLLAMLLIGKRARAS